MYIFSRTTQSTDHFSDLSNNENYNGKIIMFIFSIFTVGYYLIFCIHQKVRIFTELLTCPVRYIFQKLVKPIERKFFEIIKSQTYGTPINLTKKNTFSCQLKIQTEIFTNNNKSQYEFLLNVQSVTRLKQSLYLLLHS